MDIHFCSLLEMGLESQEIGHKTIWVRQKVLLLPKGAMPNQGSTTSRGPTGLLFQVQRGPVPRSELSELNLIFLWDWLI